jgi:hypothetical protein
MLATYRLPDASTASPSGNSVRKHERLWIPVQRPILIRSHHAVIDGISDIQRAAGPYRQYDRPFFATRKGRFSFMGTSTRFSNPYDKPYKSVAEQIDLLMSRGMAIADISAATTYLERMGYYRLSGYWYPFRKSHVLTHTLTGKAIPNPITGKEQVIVEDNYRPGTTFEQVTHLYVVDRQLRLLFLDAIERVEVALRVDIAHLLGSRDLFAHRDPLQLMTTSP